MLACVNQNENKCVGVGWVAVVCGWVQGRVFRMLLLACLVSVYLRKLSESLWPGTLLVFVSGVGFDW